MVEADVGEATLYGLHYDLLDLLEGKAQKVPERLEAHRGVDPPELLHHLQHCQALQGLRVLLKACLLGGEPGGEDHLGTQGLDGGHLRLGLRVHPHGVELALEEMEDAPHLGRAEVKEALGPELRDQRGARDHRRGARLVLEAEDRGDAFLLLPRELRVVNPPDGRAVVGQHREGSQDAVRGHEAQVALLQGLVVLPGQGVYLVPGVGVVELAVRGPEDLLETRVVGHHREGVRLAPCEGLEGVDVLHRPKRLLVHPELGRVPQLFEARGQVQVERLRIRDVGPVALVLEAVEVGQVEADQVAEPAELGAALVHHAEVVRAVCSGGVERLELRVVPQDVQD